MFLRTPKAIKELLKTAYKKGILDTESYIFADAAITMSERRVRDIMTPKSKAVSFDINNESFEEVILKMVDSGFSRFPVIKENTVIGILMLKDLLKPLSKSIKNNSSDLSTTTIDLHAIMHDILNVSEGSKINIIFKEMREERKQIAVVFDEYGDYSGIIAIEDIVEEIVGEIEDEHDNKNKNINFDKRQQGYMVHGETRIEEINAKFHIDISSDEYDTIAGFVLSTIGRIPKNKERFCNSGLDIVIIHANDRKIDKMLIKKQSNN
jgi:magnesium and cobalt transporter